MTKAIAAISQHASAEPATVRQKRAAVPPPAESAWAHSDITASNIPPANQVIRRRSVSPSQSCRLG